MHVSSISGKTELVGLIGWPVSHSVSPIMHNVAFADLGLDWSYVPLKVDGSDPDYVGDAIRGLRALGMRGANVTVPHKQSVLPFLDRLAPAAQAIGAVNTIRVEEDGALLGDNTDARGFVADLRDHDVEPAGKRALVMGAGGSARAVVYGLAQAGAAQITLLNRTLSKAEDLAASMQSYSTDCQIEAIPFPDGIASATVDADLVVNCTSLGMTPNVDSMAWDPAVPFRPGQAIYDLVYNPPVTRLMQRAATDGAIAIGGLGMLIWQGAISFEIWTGRTPSIALMRGAVEEALGLTIKT